jgi:hypothetical protein
MAGLGGILLVAVGTLELEGAPTDLFFANPFFMWDDGPFGPALRDPSSHEKWARIPFSCVFLI